jgi:hypothetical protein
VSRHQLGSLLALSIAFSLPLLACGEDNDILPRTAAPPNTQTDTQTQTDEDLTNADQLTSGDDAAACAAACPAPAAGASCCTTADDITANRAVVAGHCGVDMSSFGPFPGCSQKDQPGVLDTACPEVTIPPGPPMPGCCTASGHCGAMETFFGFGCSSNPDATTWVACGH